MSRISRGARLALLLAALGVGVGAATAAVRHTAAPLQLHAADKVDICHSNGEGSWVRLGTPVSQIIGDNGHAGHPKDIIPPFDYEGGSFPGLNWDANGQAIYENGCVLPQPQPEPIGVTASCVSNNGTTYDVAFGYNSANAADVTIPVGADNGFSPGLVNRGQVTLFHHGAVAPAFTVTGIPKTDQLTWSVNHGGRRSSVTTSFSSCPPPPEPHVSVSVACVTNGATTFDVVFGYANGGQVAVDVPIGERNNVSPGGPNRGQPVSFPPGRVDQAFTVPGIPNGTAAVWTLTSGGSTANASASASFATKCGGGPPSPQFPVVPVVECVQNHDSTYDATFGYSNPNSDPVTLPIGDRNKVSPGEPGQGQPQTFVPGTSSSVFTVLGIPKGQSVTWTLATFPPTTSSATATDSFTPKCPEPPPPEPHVTLSVVCTTKGATTFDAVFGYTNAGRVAANVPIGDANNVNPGGPNRGQPESFLPGTVDAAFTVDGIPNDASVTWTLTSGGSTATAIASASLCGGEPPGPDPVTPSVECVQNHDSTYDATFGYSNPNTDSVAIPVGDRNNVSPGGPGRGQPETFAPGVTSSAFTITGIPDDQSVTWTLATPPSAVNTAVATASFETKCSQPPEDPAIGIFVRCVTNHGGTFDATFGYQNDNLLAVTIPVGDANHFAPAPADRGQTTAFQPGNVQEAFTVTGIPSGQSVVWTLTSNGTRTATASGTFETKCSEPPATAKPIGIFVTCITKNGSTYDATFGYENDNPVAEAIGIGPGNSFSPAPIDRGQPTIFVPGRNVAAVTVTGIPSNEQLTWTLAYAGTRFVEATVGSSATATPSSPLCSTIPPISPTPPGPTPPLNPKPPDPPGPKPPVPPRAIGVFASCVLNKGATYDAIFGYVNLNVGDVIIPIGPHNHVRPGPDDQGQPETFRPGVVVAAFAVRGVPVRRAVSWTVTFGDETREATANSALSRKCVTAPIGSLADLRVTKQARPAFVHVGDRVVFTIVAKNLGRRPMRPVVITDLRFDDRVEVLSTATSLGTCRVSTSAAQSVSACGRGTLAPGESAKVRIVGLAVRAGRSVDRATTLFKRVLDATPRNNVARASVLVRARPHPRRKPPFTG